MKNCKCLIISLVSILFFSACASTPSPREVFTKYVTALNNADQNALNECIDPKMSNLAEGINGFLGDLTGFNSDNFIKMAPGILDIARKMGFKLNISGKIINETITGDTANIEADMTVDMKGSIDSYRVKFPFVKIDGKWYMSP
ncbi:MAG: hypothetical protein WCJ58_08590 [bacterium]